MVRTSTLSWSNRIREAKEHWMLFEYAMKGRRTDDENVSIDFYGGYTIDIETYARDREVAGKEVLLLWNILAWGHVPVFLSAGGKLKYSETGAERWNSIELFVGRRSYPIGRELRMIYSKKIVELYSGASPFEERHNV